MPYITQNRRDDLELWGDDAPENAGELNYALTMAVLSYVNYRPLNYQVINDVMGALEGAKQEFYRRVAVPYEVTKIAANGDVY